MSAERKADAIRALTSGDRDTLSEMGWGRVFSAILNRFQRYGSQTVMSGNESLAWLELLGDRDPASVLSALDIWAGGTSEPPKPADILGLLSRKSERVGPDTENRLRLDNNPATLAIVADYIARGEHVCECRPAPMTLVQESTGVLHCPECAGIEAGQADQAYELEHPTPVTEFRDLSAVMRLKKVRGERAARTIEERRIGA